LRLFFYSSGWYESDDLEVAYDGGADSMLQILLEKRGDGIKRYRKMKQSHQAHIGLMGKKRDTVWQRDDIDRRRCSTEEGKGRRQC
jgi:hypothetical protein